jgi:hypothetical protein
VTLSVASVRPAPDQGVCEPFGHRASDSDADRATSTSFPTTRALDNVERMDEITAKRWLPIGGAVRTGAAAAIGPRSRSAGAIRELPPIEAMLPRPTLQDDPEPPRRMSRVRIALVVGLSAIVLVESGVLALVLM